MLLPKLKCGKMKKLRASVHDCGYTKKLQVSIHLHSLDSLHAIISRYTIIQLHSGMMVQCQIELGSTVISEIFTLLIFALNFCCNIYITRGLKEP